MLRGSLAVMCAVIAATGCSSATSHRAAPTSSSPSSSPSTSQSPPATTTTTTLNCRDTIGSRDKPDPSYSAVFDRVALPTGRALGGVRLSDGPQRGKFWAKQGLLIRPGGDVELIVPAGWVGRLSIGWGNPAEPSSHLTISGCQALSPGTQWLAFAGGFWVSQPACVPLIVRVSGTQRIVHIGVGAACAGQSPPPSA